LSIRGFRDRYAALDQHAGRSIDPEPEVADWPVPAGARLVETSFGVTAVSDAEFTGAEITTARSLIETAGITPDLSTTLFIDTETTGLSGGTGTHVFLVGVGRFDSGGFTVRQYFLRHPGEERALLAAIDADISNASSMVTYNGRSFDIPMLETRFRMHHHSVRLPDHHVDLLHTARAVWKHRLSNCSLGSIERDVLGVERVDDSPGWMIPEMYFSYLRSRRVDTLRNVFNHNQQDIVSLSRLAGLIQGFQAGIVAPNHPSDRLGVALVQLRSGSENRALETIISECFSPLAPPILRYRSLRAASSVLKRQRRYSEAVKLWQEGLGDPDRTVRLFAAEELAKHLEHRSRDHVAALQIARSAADAARLAGDRQMLASLERRVSRLELRIYRHSRTDPIHDETEAL
jgi:uncharacterized protein